MDYSVLYQQIANDVLNAFLGCLPVVLPVIGAMLVIEFGISFLMKTIGAGGDDFEFSVTTTDLDIDIDYVVDEVTDSIWW